LTPTKGFRFDWATPSSASGPDMCLHGFDERPERGGSLAPACEDQSTRIWSALDQQLRIMRGHCSRGAEEDLIFVDRLEREAWGWWCSWLLRLD
jgi:hypothetical protein